MNHKSTANYYVDGYYCSYCHKFLMPYDIVNDEGDFGGTYYQCNCEKAKIEI